MDKSASDGPRRWETSPAVARARGGAAPGGRRGSGRGSTRVTRWGGERRCSGAATRGCPWWCRPGTRRGTWRSCCRRSPRCARPCTRSSSSTASRSTARSRPRSGSCPGSRSITQTRRGKGNAMACGFAAATGDVIVMFDADGSADPAEIPAFVAALVAGADFAKGCRFAAGGGSDDITLLRRTGNAGLNGVANALFGTSYTDLCYGYNAFWADMLPVLDLPAPRRPRTRRRHALGRRLRDRDRAQLPRRRRRPQDHRGPVGGTPADLRPDEPAHLRRRHPGAAHAGRRAAPGGAAARPWHRPPGRAPDRRGALRRRTTATGTTAPERYADASGSRRRPRAPSRTRFEPEPTRSGRPGSGNHPTTHTRSPPRAASRCRRGSRSTRLRTPVQGVPARSGSRARADGTGGREARRTGTAPVFVTPWRRSRPDRYRRGRSKGFGEPAGAPRCDTGSETVPGDRTEHPGDHALLGGADACPRGAPRHRDPAGRGRDGGVRDGGAGHRRRRRWGRCGWSSRSRSCCSGRGGRPRGSCAARPRPTSGCSRSGSGWPTTLLVGQVMVMTGIWRPTGALYLIAVLSVPFLLRHAVVAQ